MFTVFLSAQGFLLLRVFGFLDDLKSLKMQFFCYVYLSLGVPSQRKMDTFLCECYVSRAPSMYS